LRTEANDCRVAMKDTQIRHRPGLFVQRRVADYFPLAFGLSALLMLSSCATGPTFSQKNPSIPSLDPRLGRIYFYRTYNFVGSLVQPKLILNGTVVGKSIPGGFFWVDQPPGDYALVVRTPSGPFKSRDLTVSFKIGAGETAYVRCGVQNSFSGSWDCDNVDPAEGSKELEGLTYDGAAHGMTISAREALPMVAKGEKKFQTAPVHRGGENAEVGQSQGLMKEQRQNGITQMTAWEESAREIFKLRPTGDLSVAQVTEFLITWKNHHLDTLLRNAKTQELRDYLDEIEHTILQATDASEREKDEAQRLIAAGANADSPNAQLARAYRLRIEVLKPILAAIKEEITNRGK
jgi:Protein of unknown function (DUF2846)